MLSEVGVDTNRSCCVIGGPQAAWSGRDVRWWWEGAWGRVHCQWRHGKKESGGLKGEGEYAAQGTPEALLTGSRAAPSTNLVAGICQANASGGVASLGPSCAGQAGG
jgi:hypothetical protein